MFTKLPKALALQKMEGNSRNSCRIDAADNLWQQIRFFHSHFDINIIFDPKTENAVILF